MARESLVYNRQNGVTGGVWRAKDRVKKVLRSSAADPMQWPPSADPQHWNYWERELLAYQHGLPAMLGLDAPELLRVKRSKDGTTIALRLQALEGRSGAQLSIQDLADTAHLLGRSQAVSGDIRLPWLSTGLLDGYSRVRRIDLDVLDDELAWQQEYIAAHVDDDCRAELLDFVEGAPALRELCTRLPRTVAHLDVFPGNIIRSQDRLCLIDWGFVGDACLGEEIGNMVPDSFFDLFQPVEAIDELAERLPEAYLAGLREAGWQGDERLVWLGIYASTARYSWMVPLTLMRASSPVQTQYGGQLAEDPHRNYRARFQSLQLCARWAKRARLLTKELGMPLAGSNPAR